MPAGGCGYKSPAIHRGKAGNTSPHPLYDVEIARYALEALNIDRYGLDEIDNKILCTIIDKFKGGPVGLTTIATALGEDPGTLEEVYEPFLIKEGFLKRTPRGREVTELAYKHLGRSIYNNVKTLFDD